MSDATLPPETESREDYYAAAKSWAEDRREASDRSRGIAWIVAIVATCVALLEALALVALAPLKTVVPYTLLVDRNTGFVQALDGTVPEAIRPHDALVQSLLAQYVIARESFDVATIRDQYRKVALWSGDRARTDYLATMPPGNPGSPFSTYPRTTVVTTRIASVSAIGNQTALVRFETERQDQNASAGAPSYWVAVVHYRFSGEPLSIEDRLVNPLGFQVIGYRRDQEAPPIPEAPPVAPPASAPAASAATPVERPPASPVARPRRPVVSDEPEERP